MSRLLNILHLTTFYPPYSFGGDAMYIYRLAHAQGDQGHAVDVIHCIDSYHMQHPAEPEIKFQEHPHVQRHGLISGYGWLSPLVTQQTGHPYLKRRQINQVLASKPYDLIHFHNISLLGPHILGINSPGRRAIKLYTTHEHWLVCPMHVLWKFNSRACEKPECLRCIMLGKRPPQLWRYSGMLRRASRNVDRFLSPSRFTARMHAERGFPAPVHHLPYFIDRADNDWQNPNGRPQETPYFLFVGRLEKIKGIDQLISAWSKVEKIDLLIVGNGSQAAELRAQAADNPNIKFLGGKSQKELGALYYHALATIVPSITYETFGIIMVESFARKTPVIVRDLGALPEVVQDSDGGFIFKTEDDLLSAVGKLANEPRLRQKMGESGYRAFLDYWTREAHMKLYWDLVITLEQARVDNPTAST